MKTFADLQFTQHPNYPHFNQQARLDFDNGFGISVINGRGAYCSGSTFEIAVLKDGELTYSTPITDDVIGYQTPKQITEIMKKVQKL